MSKMKMDVANVAMDEPASAGFAHALNLLLLAIAKTNPTVGSLLDEFTTMHALYLGDLQGLAKDSNEYLHALETFAQAAKSIYKRLSIMDSDQGVQHWANQTHPASSARIH